MLAVPDFTHNVVRLTFTHKQQVVVAEPGGAFTAEAADLVDTHAVGTDTRDLTTLINVWRKKKRSSSQMMLSVCMIWMSLCVSKCMKDDFECVYYADVCITRAQYLYLYVVTLWHMYCTVLRLLYNLNGC